MYIARRIAQVGRGRCTTYLSIPYINNSTANVILTFLDCLHDDGPVSYDYNSTGSNGPSGPSADLVE
jgi:hypothetical protein